MRPLSKELLALLDAEREREELGARAVDAAWKKLAPHAGVAASASLLAHPLSKTVAACAVTFALGVGAGRVMERAAPPPPVATIGPREVASAIPGEPAPVLSTSVAPPTPRPKPTVAVVPPPRAPASSPAPASAAPSALADERVLVDAARTALLRGRPADALELAEKHAQRHPGGELAEDRDFLTVSALRDLGRTEEARARARAFLMLYPTSPLRATAQALANGQ